MTFYSHAQNFEDVILWRALKNVRHGFYIDVGAASPDVDSVSKAFYELGWSGINIEPDPTAFEKLNDERARDTNIRACAGETAGETRFFLIGASGLSTTVGALADAYREQGHAVTETKVPLLPLRAICEDHVKGDIHFLKVDVEGAEREVLLGMDFQRWRPWVVLVEATLPNSTIETSAQWDHLLRDANYEFAYFDGLNRFYTPKERPELNKFFGLPPNVFDDFAPNSARDAVLKVQEVEERAAANRKEIRRLRTGLTAAKNSRQAELDVAQLHMDELGMRLREQEALFGAATTLLRDRERTLRSTESTLSLVRTEAAQTLAGKDQDLARKDQDIERLSQQLQRADHVLAKERAELLAHIGARERQLEAVFSSNAWKFTWPFRRVLLKLKSTISGARSPSRLPRQTATAATRSPRTAEAIIAALPRKTIFIECTHTFHSDLNTGIQRVVRNVVRNAFSIADEFGFSVAPVIEQNGRYRIVTPDEILRNKLALDSPTATDHQSPGYLRPLQDIAVEDLDQIASHAGNVLLLLDSSWTTPIWGAADRFKEAGGKIAGVIYDLIPITHPHTSVPELTVFFKRWFMRHMATTDGLIAISASVGSQIRDFAWEQGRLRWYSPLAPIRHFHLGAELDFAAPSSTSPSRLSQMFGSSIPTFLMVGSIEPRKMHHFVLEGFNRLWEAGDRGRLLIVGRQAWKTEALLETIAQHPRLGTDLFILRDASDDELEFAYEKADALIIASEIEGFGLPVVEAFARGLPVLCSDIPVFREIASSHAQSFFKLDDPDFLVDAVRQFCARRREGKVKRQVVRWLTWRESTKHLFSALQDVLDRAARPRRVKV